jgi:hypothetical protein
VGKLRLHLQIHDEEENEDHYHEGMRASFTVEWGCGRPRAQEWLGQQMA